MKFEWDENKAGLNLSKHGVSFDYACYVFADDNRLEYIQDRDGEERIKVIGQIEVGVYVVIAVEHNQLNDEDVIRIISARKATSHERKYYEKNCGRFK
ncbi:MAG: BrnT family toxin [Magnetovibrio sp.]|nr:BrnT family toxin [Magnetovibrio sp.]